MGILELILISIGLSMDSFAVAVTQGLSYKGKILRYALVVGILFGLFQGAMPLIGFLVGSSFSHVVEIYDHWVAFILLLIIGTKMVKDSFKKEDESNLSCDITTAKVRIDIVLLMSLALATSIDALAVGVSFAFLHVNIIYAVLCIGIITFIFAFVGVYLGRKVGTKYKSKAEFIGGVILILMGTKILLEHLNILVF